MDSFEDLNLTKQLLSAIADLGFEKPTPMQKEAYPVILSGKDVVGIAQTGTGKTLAYILPLIRYLKYSEQVAPRILVLVPTRELVLQVVEMTKSITSYISVRVLGVYGGANINIQKEAVMQGTDILVATPGRLYDLALSNVLRLKAVQKVVIDEIDVMLDAGFRIQLKNIFELLPERRQNIMFSATMTEEVDALIDEYFTMPVRISVALSGTRLEAIDQQCYYVPNFNTKVNLLSFLLDKKEEYGKVLVFVANKRTADKLFEELETKYGSESCVIHSNKSQNYRIRSIQQFDEGINRILVTTDVMARGLDLEKITHVINFDTPHFPENYMHRIGRTGRARQSGRSILFYTDKEKEFKEAIESLMAYKIPSVELPAEVEVSKELTAEEQPKIVDMDKPLAKLSDEERGPAFHEKKQKNKKTNRGGSYLRKKKNYKKPKTRGDKISNRRKRKR